MPMDPRMFAQPYPSEDTEPTTTSQVAPPEYEEVSDSQRAWKMIAQILAQRSPLFGALAAGIAKKGMGADARNQQRRWKFEQDQQLANQQATRDYQNRSLASLDASRRATDEDRDATRASVESRFGQTDARIRDLAEENERSRTETAAERTKERTADREDRQQHSKDMAGVVAGLREPREPRETPEQVAAKERARAEVDAEFNEEERASKADYEAAMNDTKTPDVISVKEREVIESNKRSRFAKRNASKAAAPQSAPRPDKKKDPLGIR